MNDLSLLHIVLIYLVIIPNTTVSDVALRIPSDFTYHPEAGWFGYLGIDL